MTRIYILLLGAALISGCARVHAKAAPDNPPLDMPAPPERAIESSEENPPVPVELPSEPARTSIKRLPPPPRTEPAHAEPKPETPPAEAPKPPAAEEAPRTATPPLQTTPAEEVGELENAVRALMTRAQQDLNRVDYQSLNPEAKNQYEVAKSFIRQADDAIRVKNLEYARTVADKAAVIAAQLAGRR
jgi:HAMP domain-containing protein